MPIEYEMKHLYELVEDAISHYSQGNLGAYWFINIEYTVLRHIMNEDTEILNKMFKPYQIIAMKELYRRGIWVKWCEETGRAVLSRDPIHKLTSDDTKPIPQGAD